MVGLAGLLWWSQSRTESTAIPSVRARLVSDCSGPIRDWLLSLPDRESLFFMETQASLIAKADPRIQFHVYYAIDERRASLERALERRGRQADGRVRWHKSPERVWPWTRDLFLAGSTPGGRPVTFLHDRQYYGRWKLAWKYEDLGTFARTLDGLSIATPASIEGGAIVVDDERVIASAFYFEKAVLRGEAENVAEMAARMSSMWGRPVETLGVGEVHPSQHCDFVMMPVGRRRMVLASPALGARLLRAAGADERAGFRAAYRQWALRAPRGHGLKGKQELDIVAALLARNSRPDIRRGYERLKRKVERLGYACVEVPLLTLHPAEVGVGMTMSYVNAVIDERDGQRVVYMPTYRLPTLDHYAAEVWRKLGVRVVPVEALGASLHGGAIHCLSHVFRGRQAPATQ